MKHIFTVFIAIVLAHTANAQLLYRNHTLTKHNKFVNTLLQKQNVPASRSLVERTTGQRTNDNTLSSIADSVNVNYVLNGTSTYDFNVMLYPYNYPYATSPLLENSMGIHSDTWIDYNHYNHFTVNPATLVYGFYQSDKAEYDGSFNMTHDTILYADSASQPNMIHVNTYNANNDPVSTISYTWSGGNADTLFKQYYQYNGMNQLIKDSIYEFHAGTWYLVSYSLYTYDGFGNMITARNFSNQDDTTFTMPLIEQLRYNHTYDGSNRLLTVLTIYWDGTSLAPYVRDTFAYTGTTNFHTSWKQYQFDAINGYWAPMSYMHKSLGTNGYPDTVYIDYFDSLANSWVPGFRWDITYNANDNPVKLNEYIYNFTSFPPTPDFETWYYYETFNSTVGINNENTGTQVLMYPNPNNGVMLLECTTGVEGSFMLYDMAGKNVYTQTVTQSQKRIPINTGYLAPGVYGYKLLSNNRTVADGKIVINL
ncbi:MAG TPA: T9SS type A sorting domain-containing protein [Flavobacteriales bacterium]|nr:T9SS type A sorting domain-containing protein [Flavobacteriales bacterium]